jgi:hypothetical protein
VQTSDWLALAALMLSSAAFLGNMSLNWLRWPRITVDITSRINVYIPPLRTLTPEEVALREAPDWEEPEPEFCHTYDTFTIAVVNNGAEAITIRSIGLMPADKAEIRKWRGAPFVDFENERDGNQLLPAGSSLPARIEPHDVKLWVFHNHLLGTIPRSTKVLAYADRYKVFRWWPHRDRSVVRRTVSDRAVVREGTTFKAPPAGNIPPDQRPVPRT